MSDKHQQPRPPKKKPQGGQAKGFQKSGAHTKAKDQRQFNGGAHGAQPEGRARELRRRGFVIETHLVTAVDSDSFAHERVAMYALVQEPAVMEVKL